MKTLFVSIVFFASNAFAFNIPNLNFDNLDESGWSKAMTKRACKVNFSSSDVGTIDDAANGGVIYTVYSKDGVVKATAWARSTFIGAPKRCLMK